MTSKYDQYEDAPDMDKAAAATAMSSYWKPSSGENRIRMFMIPSEHTWFFQAHVHYNLGIGGRERLFCTAKGDNPQRCYGCEIYNRYASSTDDAGKDRAKDVRAKVQYYTPIVDLGHKDKGIQIFNYGVMVMADIMKVAKDPKEYGNPFSPKKGLDWKLYLENNSSDKRNNQYSAGTVRQQSAIEDMSWLDQIEERMVYEKLIPLLPYEEQKKRIDLAGGPGDSGRTEDSPGFVRPEDIRYPDEEDDMPRARKQPVTAARRVVTPEDLPEDDAPPPVEVVTGRTPVETGTWACAEGKCGAHNYARAKFCAECGVPRGTGSVNVATGDTSSQQAADTAIGELRGKLMTKRAG